MSETRKGFWRFLPIGGIPLGLAVGLTAGRALGDDAVSRTLLAGLLAGAVTLTWGVLAWLVISHTPPGRDEGPD